MSLLSYFGKKSYGGTELDQPAEQHGSSSSDVAEEPPRKKQCRQLTVSEKRKLYKAKLSYKKEWEKIYPWVFYDDPMFCTTCQKWGKPPAGSRGAWVTRGNTDWNHGTEFLKQHADSQWHRDAAATAAMAEQAENGRSVLELHCASAAKEAAERRQRNRDVLLKLMITSSLKIESLTQQAIGWSPSY